MPYAIDLHHIVIEIILSTVLKGIGNYLIKTKLQSIVLLFLGPVLTKIHMHKPVRTLTGGYLTVHDLAQLKQNTQFNLQL